MNPVVVTLVYPDGSTFLVGGFPSQAEADAWIAEEKTRPYWNPNTQVQIQAQGDPNAR